MSELIVALVIAEHVLRIVVLLIAIRRTLRK